MMSSLPKNPKQAEIRIYSKDYCPYCVAAKNLLVQRGVGFEEIDITNNPDLVKEMLEKAKPRKTVPQIFIGGFGVGGFDDLKALDQSGKLEKLIFPAGR